MSPIRRDVIAAVLLSSAAAAIADMRPPTLEATTAFITTAVERHHVRISARDDPERAWNTRIAFAECAVESRASLRVRLLERWESRTWIARWHLVDTSPADVRVTTERRNGRTVFRVIVPCDDERACVDRGPSGRDRASSLEFSSEVMALRVAAAFRHASALCEASPSPDPPSGEDRQR